MNFFKLPGKALFLLAAAIAVVGLSGCQDEDDIVGDWLQYSSEGGCEISYDEHHNIRMVWSFKSSGDLVVSAFYKDSVWHENEQAGQGGRHTSRYNVDGSKLYIGSDGIEEYTYNISNGKLTMQSKLLQGPCRFVTTCKKVNLAGYRKKLGL